MPCRCRKVVTARLLRQFFRQLAGHLHPGRAANGDRQAALALGQVGFADDVGSARADRHQRPLGEYLMRDDSLFEWGLHHPIHG
jgi:hypothetical protein